MRRKLATILASLLLVGSITMASGEEFSGTSWNDLEFVGEPEHLHIVPTSTGFKGLPNVPSDYKWIFSSGGRRGPERGVWYSAYGYRKGDAYMVVVWAMRDTDTHYMWARRYHAKKRSR